MVVPVIFKTWDFPSHIVSDVLFSLGLAAFTFVKVNGVEMKKYINKLHRKINFSTKHL